MGQASGSGDFCKGGYGTAAAASAQNKPASAVSGPGVGECRHMPRKKNLSLPSSSCVTNHPPPLLCFQSFASSLMSCVCRKTRHTSSAVQCSLPLLKAVSAVLSVPCSLPGQLVINPIWFLHFGHVCYVIIRIRVKNVAGHKNSGCHKLMSCPG